jgi:predicted O-methyltransferase YrrM
MQTQSDKPKKGRPKKIQQPVSESHPWDSEAEVGEVIASLIKLTGATKVLELGTLRGKTSTAMFNALPSGGQFTTIDISDNRSESFKQLTESSPFVEFIIGDSIKTCQRLAGSNFDLIFIDTVHEWSYALPEFKAVEALMSKGATLVYHDTIKFPDMARLINYARSFGYKAVTLDTPNGNGLTIMNRKA